MTHPNTYGEVPFSQRVVVTGLGAITPVGNDVPTAWSALLAGKSGAGPITQFDATNFRTKIAASVKDFDPTLYMDRKEVRRTDRYVQFAVAASMQALADARLDISQADPSRVGVYIGSGIGGLSTLIDQLDVLRERGVRRVSPFTVPGLMLNSASAHVSIMSGAQGPNLAMATACATGTHVIGEAWHIIRRGDADAMLVGGAEAATLAITMAGFDNMGALSCRNDAPERASRPFDAERDGFVMGEGAGMLVLERMDLAVARGAPVYAEITGYALNGDAFHITAPAEDGKGAAECMRLAMARAGISPREVDYINAHGTSTPLNDAIETRAIKTAFGDDAYRVAVSSTKSMTGHLMGSAGALEAVFCMLAMRDQILPPTINYETPDPFCDLDYVPNVARPASELPRGSVDVVMSNSFGFGGHNSAIIFQRVK